ncbi:hypothetical protein IC229_05630 [Spirosoma sp. BT702]|uniref:Zinc finger CHC2-type domain-containing protein n=1 Tax=Spirosoma profusum TaxID=2771354 RepID=A0A926XUR0_9BACT|nr:CHC2 zinc finger domain-containing protein [Spirosoma profusum]MBD2700105.1 hypothetical protein [Spirosoma profusum]
MIDPNFLERLRQQVDIVTIIGELIELKKAGSNHRGCCPFHNEKTPSLNVNPRRQIYKCFGCGKAGDVFGFVMDLKRMSFSEAVQYVAGRYNETVIYEPRTARPRSRFANLDLG